MATLLKRMVDTDNSLKDDYINRDIQVKNEIKQDLNIKNDNGVIKDLSGNILKQQATAWVNFDGSDGSIRDSYNISSVVKNDTGDYTIHFSESMNNTNYCAVVSSSYAAGTGTHTIIQDGNDYSTTSLRIKHCDSSCGDPEINNIIILGGK